MTILYRILAVLIALGILYFTGTHLFSIESFSTAIAEQRDEWKWVFFVPMGVMTIAQMYLYIQLEVYSKKHLLINLLGIFIGLCATHLVNMGIVYLIVYINENFILLGMCYLIYGFIMFVAGMTSDDLPYSTLGINYSIMTYLDLYEAYERKITLLSDHIKQFYDSSNDPQGVRRSP